MNKYLKFIFVLVISALLFGSGYFVSYKTVKKNKVVEYVPRIEVHEVVKDRFKGAELQKFRGIGKSMFPTINDGEVVTGYKVDPKEGDIIAFNCSKPEFKLGKNSENGGIKRLVKVRDDGAFFLIGDNTPISHDSWDFGWLLPSEISDVWVIRLK